MFSFGRNWLDFLEKEFSEDRVEISRKQLLEFLGAKNLYGKSFLDIGSGSGLSSLSAFNAGAASVVSFDFDPLSVEATMRLHSMHGNPKNWSVREGSILDGNFVSSLEKADIVYAWGVLHHTGDMWKALSNSISLVKNNGLLYLALYTAHPSSSYWLGIKMQYNRSGRLGRKLLESWYVLRHSVLPDILRMKNPARVFQEYKQNRGMSFITDVRDWLGGLPYQYALPEEVERFCSFFGLELVKIKRVPEFSLGNTEYVFKKI